MKTMLLNTVAALSVLASAHQATAQTNAAGANAPKYGVAVVDVSYIFKEYQKFNAEMKQMQADMKAAETALKADRDRIQGQEEQRNKYKPGSEDFKRLDEQLARDKADFNIQAGKIRRDLLEREAKVYFQTYTEVSKAVQLYAQHNQIGLVLRFNGDTVDPSKREDVLRAINQPIVHQNAIDITPDVLALLNRSASSSAAQPARNVRR